MPTLEHICDAKALCQKSFFTCFFSLSPFSSSMFSLQISASSSLTDLTLSLLKHFPSHFQWFCEVKILLCIHDFPSWRASMSDRNKHTSLRSGYYFLVQGMLGRKWVWTGITRGSWSSSPTVLCLCMLCVCMCASSVVLEAGGLDLRLLGFNRASLFSWVRWKSKRKKKEKERDICWKRQKVAAHSSITPHWSEC